MSQTFLASFTPVVLKELEGEIDLYFSIPFRQKTKRIEKSPTEFNVEEPNHTYRGQTQLVASLFKNQSIAEEYQPILDSLLRQALTNGIYQEHVFNYQVNSPSEGSTASFVGLANTDVFFATKIDSDPKLVREAAILQMISLRTDLPGGFSHCFPKVYAIKKDKPPYGYIMEAFKRQSFAGYLYKEELETEEIKIVLSNVLQVLFGAYTQSINKNLTPNIDGLYLGRIKERLETARRNDKTFGLLSKKSITINGVSYLTPENYISKIETAISSFGVSFTSFVHGDVHPENILIDPKDKTSGIKFIDPKDWYEGDYMFDMGKICHYLEAAGPVEKSNVTTVPVVDALGGTITYEINAKPDPGPLVQIVKDKIRAFARANQDSNWERRYDLSMASNLLGMPAIRIAKGHTANAYIFYAEGLKYLAKCV